MRRALGDVVGDLVDAVTARWDIDDYEKRRLDVRARACAHGHRAVALYAADRLAELRSLRAGYRERGDAVARPYEVTLAVLTNDFERDLRMLDRATLVPPFRKPIAYELDALRTDCMSARRARRSGAQRLGPTPRVRKRN